MMILVLVVGTITKYDYFLSEKKNRKKSVFDV